MTGFSRTCGFRMFRLKPVMMSSVRCTFLKNFFLRLCQFNYLANIWTPSCLGAFDDGLFRLEAQCLQCLTVAAQAGSKAQGCSTVIGPLEIHK